MGRSKDLRKKIAAELEVINEHLARIAEEYTKPFPDKRGIEAWEKDIARHLRILEKLRNKLPGNKKG